MSVNSEVLQEYKPLVKSAALRFLGDDPLVRQQFELDTMERRPPAPAPPILFQILDVLYQNSQTFLNIFTTLFITFLAYRLGRRAAEKDKDQLISEMRKILKENQDQLSKQLRINRNLRRRLKWSVPWILQGLADRKTKRKWEIRVRVYTERTDALLDSDKAAGKIYEIFMEVTPEEFPRELRTND